MIWNFREKYLRFRVCKMNVTTYPLISVIVPVYNMESYIKRCLTSILNNTYKNLEIICVNDGSQDESLRILKEFSDNDERVIVIDKQNGGVASARNLALKSSRGEYIAFIDPDDWIHINYFELLYKAIIKSNSDLVICRHEVTDRFIKDIKINNSLSAITKLDFDSFFSDVCAKDYVWGRLYRKEILESIQFDEQISICEDNVFNIELICRSPSLKVSILEEKLYYYFQRSDSAVHLLTTAKNLLPVAKRYFSDFLNSLSNDKVNKIYIQQVQKNVLAVRYLAMYSTNKNEINRICELMLKRTVKEMWNNSLIGLKEKLGYTLFWRMPILYRLFRICDDRTLLDWEKRQKEKFKSNIVNS